MLTWTCAFPRAAAVPVPMPMVAAAAAAGCAEYATAEQLSWETGARADVV